MEPTTTTEPRPSPSRPPLRRDRDGRMVGGVASGLAHHLDVDVVLVRIGFVIGAILTQGLGVLAYVLGWIFIPAAEPGTSRPPSRAERPETDGRGAAFWLGVGLLAFGALWLLAAMPWPVVFGFGLLDAGILVPVLLIGLGIALWRTSGRPATAPPPPSPTTASAAPDPVDVSSEQDPARAWAAETPEPTPPTSFPSPQEAAMSAPPSTSTSNLAAPSWESRVAAEPSTPVDEPRSSGFDAPPPPPPAPEGGGSAGDGFTPPPVPKRKRSILGQLTFGVALITVGILWILEVTAIISLGPLRIAAIGLAVIGAGLLVGSVVGRGRWLIVIGLLLVPLVLVGSLLRGLPAGDLLDASFRGNAIVGERVETPQDLAELTEGYALGAGRLELDLRELEFTEDVSSLIEVGAGEVLVIVPDDINLDIRSSLGGGEITLFGRSRSGLGVDHSAGQTARGPDAADAATLSLRINAGFGDITVRD